MQVDRNTPLLVTSSLKRSDSKKAASDEMDMRKVQEEMERKRKLEAASSQTLKTVGETSRGITSNMK